MPKKHNVLIKFITILLAISLVVLMLLASYLFIANSPVRVIPGDNSSINSDTTTEVEKKKSDSYIFNVLEGQSVYGVISALESENFIRNANFLKAYIKFFAPSLAIRSGEYAIPHNLTAINTIHYLADTIPQHNLMSITIPEGLSLREVSLLWEKAGFFSSKAFLDASMDPDLLKAFAIPTESFEGWLFPDTYVVSPSITAHQAVELMANQFFKVLQEIYPLWQTLSIQELNDRIILASIVQKEHQIPDEAPLMASVFLNRLDIGMPLGTDATISYAKKERLGEGHVQRILFSDLTMDDPYNSYTNLGLPPGAIGLSGRTALRAVFYPPETDFLYFVRIPESAGKHHFSKTYQEHLYHANIWRSWADKHLR